MKHGDKAKVKTAKASSKASVKKPSKNGGPRPQSKDVKAEKSGSKGVKTAKTGKSVETAKGAGHEAVAAAKPKAVVNNGRTGPEPGGFSNAAVAAAFKRAVKKYPNAFRRLTD